LSGQQLPAAMQKWLNGFPIPENVRFEKGVDVDWLHVLAHFAYPLLPKAYADSDEALLHALLQSVNRANLRSASDRFLWELRLLKIRLNG
jgi:hypothetical protein